MDASPIFIPAPDNMTDSSEYSAENPMMTSMNNSENSTNYPLVNSVNGSKVNSTDNPFVNLMNNPVISTTSSMENSTEISSNTDVYVIKAVVYEIGILTDTNSTTMSSEDSENAESTERQESIDISLYSVPQEDKYS